MIGFSAAPPAGCEVVSGSWRAHYLCWFVADAGEPTHTSLFCNCGPELALDTVALDISVSCRRAFPHKDRYPIAVG